MKAFKALAAMAENRVIGQGNRLPWHLPEDFKWFKAMTTGQIVVMGRKTFQSLPKPLPNRRTIVLSRSGFSHPNVEVRSDLDPAEFDQDARQVFICGGAEVYRLWLPRCSDLYLTRVRQVVEGDAFLPVFEHLFDFVLHPFTVLRLSPDQYNRHRGVVQTIVDKLLQRRVAFLLGFFPNGSISPAGRCLGVYNPRVTNDGGAPHVQLVMKTKKCSSSSHIFCSPFCFPNPQNAKCRSSR